MHQSDTSPSLQGIRTGPALTALAEAATQALSQLAQELRACEQASKTGGSFPAGLDKNLADIEGALRFAGACSQAALLTLMRQLLSATAAPVSHAAQVSETGIASFPTDLIDMFAQACDCLIATLQIGRAHV